MLVTCNRIYIVLVVHVSRPALWPYTQPPQEFSAGWGPGEALGTNKERINCRYLSLRPHQQPTKPSLVISSVSTWQGNNLWMQKSCMSVSSSVKDLHFFAQTRQSVSLTSTEISLLFPFSCIKNVAYMDICMDTDFMIWFYHPFG